LLWRSIKVYMIIGKLCLLGRMVGGDDNLTEKYLSTGENFVILRFKYYDNTTYS